MLIKDIKHTIISSLCFGVLIKPNTIGAINYPQGEYNIRDEIDKDIL